MGGICQRLSLIGGEAWLDLRFMLMIAHRESRDLPWLIPYTGMEPLLGLALGQVGTRAPHLLVRPLASHELLIFSLLFLKTLSVVHRKLILHDR